MLKAILLGFVGVIVGLLCISYMILPVAADLLEKPGIESWTGLGAGLRLLGLALVGSLYVGYLRAVYKSLRDDE